MATAEMIAKGKTRAGLEKYILVDSLGRVIIAPYPSSYHADLTYADTNLHTITPPSWTIQSMLLVNKSTNAGAITITIGTDTFVLPRGDSRALDSLEISGDLKCQLAVANDILEIHLMGGL